MPLSSREKRRGQGLLVQRFQPVFARAYSVEVLADSPKAFWKCQEAASAKPVDFSGNALDMTTQAGTAWWQETGPFCDGQDPARSDPPSRGLQKGDYGIVLPQFRRNVVSTAVNNWTMEIWVMAQGAFSDVGIICGNGDGGFTGGANNGYDLFWSGTGGKFQCGYRSVSVNSDSAATLATKVWNHIVVCRDAGTLKYFLNGALDTANADSTHTPGVPTSGANGGTKMGSGAVAQKLAYFAFYETALSAARVAAHFGAMVGG